MSVLLAALWVPWADLAAADCMVARPGAPDAEAAPVQVRNTWKARHVHRGLLDGCIATFYSKERGEFNAYTGYDFICALGKNETLAVTTEEACCDAGDDGDFVCGVKALNPLAGVSQLWSVVRPRTPDERAIPDLMRSLEKSTPYAARICAVLATYFHDPKLAKRMTRELPRLRELAAEASPPARQSAVAALLLDVDHEPAPNRAELRAAMLRGNFGPLAAAERAAVTALAADPSAGADAAAVLVALLTRTSPYPADFAFVVAALPGLGARLQPQLGRVYAAVATAAPAQWKPLLCAAFPVERGAPLRRLLWAGYPKVDPVTCGG